MFFIFVVLLLTSFVFSLGFKRLTSSSCSYCLVLEFAHKSGYGVIMHFYKLFRVLTLFSENCSYNTLRFIFIILLPVKAAWSHDDDDDDDDYSDALAVIGWTFGCSGWRKKLAWLLSCLIAVWSGVDWSSCYIFKLARFGSVLPLDEVSWSRSGRILSARAESCVAPSWISYIAPSRCITR